MADVDLALYETTNSGTSLSTLANAFDAEWTDETNGQGRFRFMLPLGDADVALCTYGRIVRFGLAGSARWAGVIDTVVRTPIEEQREGIESMTVSGAGMGIELDEAKIRKAPTNKSPGTIADIFPPIDDRPQEWYGVDFDDSSGWVNSTEVGTHGESSAVSPGLPGGMRVLGAKWIWSNDTPGDDFLFFREWVFLYEGFYCLDFCAYDARCYINGRAHPRNAAYNAQAERVEFTVINSGYILLAFEADYRDTVGYDRGLVWQITEGQEGPLVYASGSAMQVYDTPDAVLSMTAGGSLLQLKTDHDALDDWTFDFTATLDSDGNSLSDISAVTARIGDDSMWDILTALAEVYIDFEVAASTKTLRIYEKGTKAGASLLPIVVGGSLDAETEFVNVKELSWEGRRAPFNALQVRYESGWFEYPDPLPTNPRWGTLGIPHVASGATAIQFAAALLDSVGTDDDVATLELVRNLPDEQIPYVGFDRWSLLDVPSAEDVDATVQVPVKAITCRMDADGQLEATVELGSLVEDYATRIERWIARSTRGGLSGLVQMAQGIIATQQQRTPGLSQTDVKIIDVLDADTKVGVEKSATLSGKGLVHKVWAMVNSTAGGTYSIDVVINGTTVTLSGTVAAGFQRLDLDEGLSIPVDPRTPYSGEVTAASAAGDITVYVGLAETR